MTNRLFIHIRRLARCLLPLKALAIAVTQRDQTGLQPLLGETVNQRAGEFFRIARINHESRVTRHFRQ